MFRSRSHRLALVTAGATALIAVPALAAGTANETLSNFKISGASSAKAGTVSFKVKNTASMGHEFAVIRTNTKAAKLKLSGGKASEKGKIGEVQVAGGKTSTLKLKLKKGHYVLICNIGGHYMAGMHKDFTVK